MSVKLALIVLTPVMMVVTLYYTLGSVREAEEFDRLSPDQAKEKLAKIAQKMDLNNDQHVDRVELKQWIMNNFL